MEEHGVVPDVIDTAPADELEVSVMNIHRTLNGSVYCCKFLLWRWKHYGVLKCWWPPPGLITPLSWVAWWCGVWKTYHCFVRICLYCLLLQCRMVNSLYSCTLKMAAAGSSNMLVPIHQSTLCQPRTKCETSMKTSNLNLFLKLLWTCGVTGAIWRS